MNQFFEEGLNSYKSGKLHKAVNDFSKAIFIDPFQHEYFYQRGLVYSDLKYFDQALKDFNMALKISPSDGKAYFSRGQARLNLNDKVGACSDWQIAGNLGIKEAAEKIVKYCDPSTISEPYNKDTEGFFGP